MFDANLNTILMCAGQQMEYILNLHWVWKNLFELLFTMVCIQFLCGYHFLTSKLT
jgi:hypothetical protein